MSYLCRDELRYGVMVALQILVLSVQVRILVSQHKRSGVATPFMLRYVSYPRASHHPGGVLGEALLLRSLTLMVVASPPFIVEMKSIIDSKLLR